MREINLQVKVRFLSDNIFFLISKMRISELNSKIDPPLG